MSIGARLDKKCGGAGGLCLRGKHSISFALGTLLLLAGIAHPQSKAPVTIAGLLSVKTASDLSLSPRGDYIAYVEDEKVYLRSTQLKGSPVEIGPGRSPQWSPGGDALAFFRESPAGSSIMLRDQNTGVLNNVGLLAASARPLTPLRWNAARHSVELVYATSEESTPSRQATSPKEPLTFPNEADSPALGGLVAGTTIASSEKVAPSDLYLFSSDTGQSNLLLAKAPAFNSLDWSPNGAKLIGAVPSSPHAESLVWTSTLFEVDIKQGTLRPLRTVSSCPATGVHPQWSYDGKSIAYTASAKPFAEEALFVLGQSGEPINVSAKLGLSVLAFAWASDSKSLILQLAEGVTRPLMSLDLASGRSTLLNDTEVGVTEFSISKSGDAAWMESTGSTFEVIRFRAAHATRSIVLEDLNPQLSTWQLGAQEILRWKNKAGDVLEGILIKPVGYQTGHRYPLIVDPYSDRVNDFQGKLALANQMLAGKGYALFFPDHRGPQTFAPQLIRNAAYARPTWTTDPGAVEVEDILSGVDALVQRGIADPDRLALYSFSNGASAINLLITKTSRFKAAVSGGGVADWLNYYLFRTADDWTIPYFLDGKTPETDLALYLSISPLYHLGNVSTPLLLITGDKDMRALQAVMLYNGLRRLGKPVELLRYTTDEHEISDTNLEDYWSRVEAFLTEHLRPVSPLDKP